MHILQYFWDPNNCFRIFCQWLTFAASLGYTLISGIYGAVVTSQNGGDKAQT